MIEINLIPGGASRAVRGSQSPSGARARRTASPWHVAVCVPGLATLLVLALMHPGARDRQRALEVRLAQAVRDSTDLAAATSAAQRLRAGRDSVAGRMRIIQELDLGRYAWPRVLHEVALAVPELAWLTRIAEADATGELQVVIEGRAANTFALTRFMNRLEASRFLGSVSLAGTEQVAERLPDGGEWMVRSFVLRVGYRPRLGPREEPMARAGAGDSGSTEVRP